MTSMVSLIKKYLSYACSEGLSAALKRTLRWVHWNFYELHRLFDNDFYPIFICGIAGSGTTLLSGLLDQRYKTAGSVPESALMMPDNSSLRMTSVASYGTVARYYKNMFISDDISDRAIRTSILKLYRKRTRYPKQSRIVIDKAANTHLVRAKRLRAALPQSKFLLIFRDPVKNIEGLRRKWPHTFGQVDLAEVCDFWETVHKIFLEDTECFSSDVMGISYNELVRDTDAALEELAKFCGLQLREKPLKYPETPNIPGKGLRNVVNGEIRVVQDADSEGISGLSPEQCTYIRKRLLPMYEELNQLCEE